ncbi:MAG: class IV adenylate cyclase [Desulfobacteraceae bacterium]|nr:class IV adenylate cyclase [Desulfobacteraceae bacterium]
MAKNIEIKAALDDVAFYLKKAGSLSDTDPEIIEQKDYFFNCSNGRLKLRFFSDHNGELIFYKRNNQPGPKACEYFITKTSEPGQLLKVLKKAHGIFGVVKKTRTLFLIGRCRVHIDQVKDLGNYLEFEVVLSEDEQMQVGKNEADLLMKQFNIKDEMLIDCAYVDLLKSKQ